jgi:bacteriorhodopsin
MSDITLAVWEFELVSHVLTLGYAVMAAGLLYFWLTIRQNLPKYRMSNILSVVVSISALLLLFVQQQNWVDAYKTVENPAGLVIGYESIGTFSNGPRYLNWLIDVPNLLTQILFVAGISGVMFRKYWRDFTLYGMLMIVTGYIGQFYEPGRPDGENLVLWLVWGAISTVFYVPILTTMSKVIDEGTANITPILKKKNALLVSVFKFIKPWFYITWTIYPIAYLMPGLFGLVGLDSTLVVSQQVLYTLADVTSKVIYGIMLNTVSTFLSTEEGFQEAN